jgi:carbon monoxide dehydrogenase subunit G
VELKNEFEVNMPADRAWPLLLDVPEIVQCVPGAELLNKLDDRSFKGRVSIKLGPILLTFDGIAKFAEIETATHRTRVEARGTDKKGRGSAQATVMMQVIPNGALSKVSLVTDLQLFGSIAQYGRASGLIADVSAQLVDEFAANLNRRIMESVSTSVSADTRSAPKPATRAPVKAISGFGFALRVLWRSLTRLFRMSKAE